jgi:prepilin-type N-terminal cleavage/methylation domain-containing protein
MNESRIRRRSLRAGFTLIELLAVITIIAILAAALAPQIPKFIDRGKVTACRANLQELFRNFELYKQRFKGDWPNESGILFFLKLWKVDTESQSDQYASRFTCPGVAPRYLTGISGREPREWFSNWNELDSTYTAYAGRDISKFPNVDKSPGNQALLGDDNELADTEQDPMSNHMYTTLVLMADGSIHEFDIAELRDKELVAEKGYPIAGPDSQVPELKTLSREAIRKK